MMSLQGKEYADKTAGEGSAVVVDPIATAA
jgi:hypothetical protein